MCSSDLHLNVILCELLQVSQRGRERSIRKYLLVCKRNVFSTVINLVSFDHSICVLVGHCAPTNKDGRGRSCICVNDWWTNTGNCNAERRSVRHCDRKWQLITYQLLEFAPAQALKVPIHQRHSLPSLRLRIECTPPDLKVCACFQLDS